MKIGKHLLWLYMVGVLVNSGYTQKNAYNWFFGSGPNHNLMSFHNDTVQVSLRTSPLSQYDQIYASISDNTGHLQFYTNGCALYNNQDQVIENSESFQASYPQSYACGSGYYSFLSDYIIIPDPAATDSVYYIFYSCLDTGMVNGFPIDEFDTYRYALVDMRANNGLGTVRTKNVILHEYPDGFWGANSRSAIRHANGRDWWIISSLYEHTNIFHRYLVTPKGVEGPFMQTLDTCACPSEYRVSKYLNFSADGSRCTQQLEIGWYADSSWYELYDFDRCTGLLSYRQLLTTNDAYSRGGSCLSPNGHYLYISNGTDTLFQYDTHAPDIGASRQVVAVMDGYEQVPTYPVQFNNLIAAPDDKIYISCAPGSCMSVINQPNNAGTACDVMLHNIALLYGGGNNAGTAFPNYQLGALDGSPCDTLGLNPVYTIPNPTTLVLSPNPATAQVQLQFGEAVPQARVRLYTLEGRQVGGEQFVSNAVHTIDVGHLPKGMYLVQVYTDAGLYATQKLVVQ